jgi:site-specific DNA recombinase
MAANSIKPVRCAIYTRKSTEHGLELEFNSLDAQREACEAYIKSQASQGWRALPQHYDDPAYSGGNLDRPALQQLLKDIDAGRIDVVVVYKIDRLTRSLADFAKLVEAFDARSISFVAVTQQFNTTTSMGRLTLNVLLSFAQFERELSSERVRDKIADSRRKGKWTGGTVPLGYEARDKKLVVNKAEAETVRVIFSRYLELQSFSKLVADLDRRGIVTKRRTTKVAKYNGGIPFTYGPLAYFFRNRVYLGEIHHGGKWFRGEHKPILDRPTFDRVQQLLSSNTKGRKATRSESGALLTGLLFDDKGNRMSPSFSSKNGVRYRFYVSSALLRGRKAAAGSVSRIAASEIESAVLAALEPHQERDGSAANPVEMLKRVVLGRDHLLITIAGTGDSQPQKIKFAMVDQGKEPCNRGGKKRWIGKREQRELDPIGGPRPWLDAFPARRSLRVHRRARQGKRPPSQGGPSGTSAGVSFARRHVSHPGRQAAQKACAGAHPKTASVVVGKACPVAWLSFPGMTTIERYSAAYRQR